MSVQHALLLVVQSKSYKCAITRIVNSISHNAPPSFTRSQSSISFTTFLSAPSPPTTNFLLCKTHAVGQILLFVDCRSLLLSNSKIQGFIYVFVPAENFATKQNTE